MGKDIIFSDLLITRAGMLSTKCQMVYVYGHSVRAKNGQVLLRCGCETERFLSWGPFRTLMHKLHRLIRCCLLILIFCKLSYGWCSVSCSYSDAFLHTEFAVMGFFLLKYALHLGISHYAAWLLLPDSADYCFFTASLPKRSEDSYRTCRLCHSYIMGWPRYQREAKIRTGHVVFVTPI